MPDRLDPWLITNYLMQIERITCSQCGQVAEHTRLWLRFRGERNSFQTRIVGASETIYSNIPIHRDVKDWHSRACPSCIATVKLETWTKPEAAATAASPRAPGGIARSAGYSAKPAKRPSTPEPSARPRTLAEIMAQFNSSATQERN